MNLRPQLIRLVIAIGSIVAIPCGFAGSPAADAAWPGWGGAQRDFRAPAAKLAPSWPARGPAVAWTQRIGPGHAGLVVADGTLYTLYRQRESEVIAAFDAASGARRWEHRYAAPYHDGQTTQFGRGPNSTPLVAGDRLVSVGFTSKLFCVDRRSGAVLWSHDLVRSFGAAPMHFGYAASPLRLGDTVVVLVGGERHGVVALDLADGTPRWSSGPISISYASPRVIRVGDEDQLVFMSSTAVVGISADDGSDRWSHPHENQFQNNCAGPWWSDDETLFVASQGAAGARTLQLAQIEGRTVARELVHDRSMKVFYSSAVRRGDVIYAGSHEALVAYDVRAGRQLWRLPGFAEANLVDIGEQTVMLDERGELVLATLTPEGATIHSRADMLDRPARTSPTPVGSRLFLRGTREIVALDLGPQVTTGDVGNQR